MKNFISVNAKHYKKREINRISEHNFRLQKIGYLLPKEHIKYDNINIIYDNTNIIYENKTNENNLTKLGQYTQNLNEIFNKKELDNILKSQYELLLNKKEKIQYKNKSYAKTNESTLVEMVVALSEEQAKFYLESGKDLGVGFDNFTKKLCEKYGFTPLQVSLHLDEGNVENGVTKLNVHAHLTFFNFNFEKERSVLRTLKKQDYKDLQDLAANSFQEVGLNFVRGEGKEITNKKHLERNDFILSKQKQQIESYDLILKSLIPRVNEEKKDLKALLNTFNKDSVEYNLVYNLVGSTITLEKELRKYSKIDDFNKENKDEIINLLKKHLEKVKPIVGKDFYKLENSNALIHNLEKFAQKISNVNLEFTQNQEKDKKIEELEKELNKQQEQNSIILDKLNEERSKNKHNEAETSKILQQNKKLIEILDRQHKTTQRQSRTNTRLRNQRNKFFQKLMRDNNLTKAMQTRKFLKDNKTKSLNKSKIEKKQESYDFDR
ncbi:hypothetical protein [Aliarcobacter butzleri]|uniref:hypothetical protein n=1 Tax=Aliarcobacter butzleri TaxID=28197 RepID=UPI0021B34ECF|nr:hypothetical protein [Aliarcobacter butzleri]MCT7639119.1 hypothetical protein [Aliarcobacter butzleri]